MLALTAMLPMRPFYKSIARRVMHQRIEKHLRRASRPEQELLIAEEEIPAQAWEKRDEFRLGVNMYDVVGVRYTAGKKYYRCLIDKLERQAERAAEALVQDMAAPSPHTPKGKLGKAFSDWLQGLFYESPFEHRPHVPERVACSYAAAPVPRAVQPFLSRLIEPPEA